MIAMERIKDWKVSGPDQGAKKDALHKTLRQVVSVC